MKSTRRDFLQKSALGLTATAFTGIPLVSASPKAPAMATKKQDPFQLGIAGYSFVHFSLEQSLEMMKKVDAHFLCIKDFHLPYDSSSERIAKFHQQLADSGVTGYAVGPIYTRTKEEIDKAFEYAKRVGVNLIIGIPEPGDLNYLNEKVKEFNIRYAIHNHGPEDKLYPNATVIYNYIKDLDARIGICFDMGHNTRDGQDSIADLKKYHSRIFDMHLKNVTSATAEGKPVN